MNSPDENPLLKEILADEKLSDFRRASLEGALIELRHARQRRNAVRVATWVLLPLVLIAFFVWRRPPQESVESRPAHFVSEVSPPDETAVKTISDEELFALFPNRALALVGPPGQQQLVFLDATAHN